VGDDRVPDPAHRDVHSLGNEDYPVLIAYTLIAAVLTVLGNLLADIALTIADPRIRLS
jgi:peptide/nickel transport system permease protein